MADEWMKHNAEKKVFNLYVYCCCFAIFLHVVAFFMYVWHAQAIYRRQFFFSFFYIFFLQQLFSVHIGIVLGILYTHHTGKDSAQNRLV